jgi:hypothetical protein
MLFHLIMEKVVTDCETLLTLFFIFHYKIERISPRG